MTVSFVRRPVHRLLAPALLLFALAGCGGEDPETQGLPEQTTATVDAGGAVLEVQELSLTLPPQALTTAVPLSLGKVPAASTELARYNLTPAGQALKQPSEIRFERAGLPERARFFWEVDGELWLVPTTRSGNVLSARLSTLGYVGTGAAAAGGRPRAQALRARPLDNTTPGNANLVIALLDCQAHAQQLALRMEQALAISDMALAVGLADDVAATEAACVQIDLRILEQRSCDVLAVAVSRAEVLFAADFAEFKSLATPLFSAKAFVQLTGAACTSVDPASVEPLVKAKFEQFLAVLQSQQLRGDFAQEAGKRELDELMSYHAHCQTMGLTTSCQQLTDVIYPNLLDGMRQAAFDECRGNGLATAVAQFHALGSDARNEAKFMDFGRFGRPAVEADLAYCTNPSLELHVFDNASGVPDELTARAQTLRPLAALGSYAIGAEVEVPREAGSLTVGGRVAALRCGDGTVAPSDLVVRINGREVARRGTGGNEYTLGTSPLDLVLASVVPAAGLDLQTISGFTLEFFREGGQCTESAGPAFTAPFKMFEIRVNLGSLPATVFLLRGPMNFSFSSTEVDDVNQPIKPRREVTEVAVTGRIEESASGGLKGFLTTLSGSVVETRTSLSSFDRINIDDGSHCTFEFVTDREQTTTFVVSAATRLSLGLQFSKAEMTIDEFSVNTPTRVVSKTRTTLRNQAGNCSKVDTSPPPPTTETFDSEISLNELFSLTRPLAFRAPVLIDAAGRRSVTLSDSVSDSLPGGPAGPARSQTSSFTATLVDTPQ
jgi:hypothetical protein